MAVTGEILIGADCPTFEGATARVELQDVSRADTASRLVAVARMAGIAHRAGEETRVPFELRGSPANPRASYALRVHVVRHAGEEVEVGDLVSTEHVAVTSQRLQGHRVRVRLVT
jgi:uncharacterized lipoprotein YbaY